MYRIDILKIRALEHHVRIALERQRTDTHWTEHDDESPCGTRQYGEGSEMR